MGKMLIDEAIDDLVEVENRTSFIDGVIDVTGKLDHLTTQERLGDVATAIIEVMLKKDSFKNDLDLLKACTTIAFRLGAKAQELYEADREKQLYG